MAQAAGGADSGVEYPQPTNVNAGKTEFENHRHSISCLRFVYKLNSYNVNVTIYKAKTVTASSV